jgi:Ca-activated chloride channel homolog
LRFTWPQMLWCLFLVPIFAGLYWHALKRRRKHLATYSSLSLIKPALVHSNRWRQHLPAALLGLALIPLILAMARPSSTFTLPSDKITLVLAMDVSLSMRATDMKPNRISAAKDAAKAFIKDLPKSIHVGIVAFAGTATVVQTPTDNHEELLAAIDAFQLQRGTATGSALLSALNVLLPDSGVNLEQSLFDPKGAAASGKSGPSGKAETGFAPVAAGSYGNGAIILLSDGRRTTGVDPVSAAQLAADRGVKVYTIGFGAKDGTPPISNGDDSWSFYLRLDETALKQMATITKGEYQHAGSSADLKKVYEGFNTKFSMERRETEVGFALAGVGLLLALMAVVLSLRWMRGH